MDAAILQLRRGGVFVLVDHILVDRQVHQLMDLGVEPGLAEGRQILPRVAVQKKLIPNQRVGHIGPHPVFGHPVFWNREVSSLGTENIRVRRTPCVVPIMKRHMFS